MVKIGYRMPSPSKMLKARTTDRLKRAVKKSINPVYGKKGMGLIDNPKKSVYNKVYSKTTKSVFGPSLHRSRKQSNYTEPTPNSDGQSQRHQETNKSNAESGSGTATFFGFMILGCLIFGNWIGVFIFLLIGGLLVWIIRKADNNDEIK